MLQFTKKKGGSPFFYEQKEKGLLDKQKEEEKIFNKEDCFLRQKKKENLFQYSQRDSLGNTNSPTPIKPEQAPSHEDPC